MMYRQHETKNNSNPYQTVTKATKDEAVTYVYRHDPYSLQAPEVVYDIHAAEPEPMMAAEEIVMDDVPHEEIVVYRPGQALPIHVLHGFLSGRVSFVPYPKEPFAKPEATCKKEDMTRVFLGQLPYQVTDMQLDWLIWTFAAASVHFPERITKYDPQRGQKVPTGCIHAYCDPKDVAHILAGVHKKLLIDDSGVWMAEGEEEQKALNGYCNVMKVDRQRRFQGRPYDTVVAQMATSHYVPPTRNSQ